MPWTVKDVDKHRKGLTPSQKKKWVSIANAVLKDCQSKKGKDCEGKAIRVANSKFSESGAKMSLPKGALHLIDKGNDCHAFAEDVGDGKKKLKMKIYSGKLIKHWYWNNLAIDLEGGQFPMSRYPILEDHMTSRKVAFTGKPIIDKDGIHVDSEKTTFVSTKESEDFQRLSAEGFPFQASIYARPTVVERVEEGDSVEVNGFTLKGPGSVWRKWEFKEGSVCVFGYDSQTQSSAFSRTEQEEIEFEEITKMKEDSGENTSNINSNEEEVSKLDLKELKEKHPELVKEIETGAVAKFKEEQNAEVSALRSENEKLSKDVLELNKREQIRTENELKLRADVIWDKALAASEVSERLYDKIKPHVSYSKFVENDTLNETKFKEAIDAEIKDWVGRGVTGTVLGGGYQSKEVIDSATKKFTEEKKQNDDSTNFLLNLAGQKTDEK